MRRSLRAAKFVKKKHMGEKSAEKLGQRTRAEGGKIMASSSSY